MDSWFKMLAIMMKISPFILLAPILLSGCATFQPSSLADNEPYLVVAKSARMPDFDPWLPELRFSTITWLDLKKGSDSYWRTGGDAG